MQEWRRRDKKPGAFSTCHDPARAESVKGATEVPTASLVTERSSVFTGSSAGRVFSPKGGPCSGKTGTSMWFRQIWDRKQTGRLPHTRAETGPLLSWPVPRGDTLRPGRGEWSVSPWSCGRRKTEEGGRKDDQNQASLPSARGGVKKGQAGHHRTTGRLDSPL